MNYQESTSSHQRPKVWLLCVALAGCSMSDANTKSWTSSPEAAGHAQAVSGAHQAVAPLVEAPANETDTNGSCGAPGQPSCASLRPYRHPFQDVALVDGQIPLLDVKNSPDGRRYATVDQVLVPSDEGPSVTSSRIVELERRFFSAEERAAYVLRKESTGEPPQDTGYVAPRVSPRLAVAIEEVSLTGVDFALRVNINVRRPGVDTVQQRLERAIALGQIKTKGDYQPAREAVMEEIGAEVAAGLAPIVETIGALGGRVIYQCEHGYCLSTEMSAAQVVALSADERIQRMDLDREGVDQIDLDNITLMEVYQANQFWDLGYDGENGNSTDVTLAIVERSKFRDTHDAYMETTTGSRIRGTFECDLDDCDDNPAWTANESHATLIAGCAFSDLTDGQQSGLTDDEEKARSSPGREAKAWLYGNMLKTQTGSTGVMQYMWDHINSEISPTPAIVTGQLAWDDATGPGGECGGEEYESVNLDNLLYEAGISTFYAAGNSTGSATVCEACSPATAMGAFTVGGFGDGNYTDTSTCATRSLTANSSSSWGGVNDQTNDGKGRSIIDIMGSYYIKLRSDIGSDTSYSDCPGTSCTTPNVASAATNVIDMYENEVSSAIYTPGVLYATMLLMGDRVANGGSKLVERFDHHGGAGRLRMRAFNAEGLDAPAEFAVGHTCVDHNETVTLPAPNNGTRLSADVESFKAVIWWYDRRLETEDTIDDLDLFLLASPTELRLSNDFYDNKEMVYYNDVGDKALTVQVYGYNVTADDEGCGTNSMKVYYAYIYEDDDRDDIDGPDYDSVNCVGVEPL